MKHMKTQVIGIMVVVLLCVAAGSAHAAVITFQDGFNGYDGTADTYIHTKYSRAIQNYGAFGWTMAATPDARFQAGLIRFDDIFGSGASQIPAGQTIVSASLVMCSMQQEFADTTNTHDEEMIADPMATPWVEGNGQRVSGSTGQIIEGATCGAARHYRADGDYASHPEDSWGNTGAVTMGPTAADLNTSLRATSIMDQATYGTLNSSLVPTDYFNSTVFDVAEFDVTAAVQAWADGTLDNNGWYLHAWVGYSWQYYYTSDYAVDVTGTPENPIDLTLRPKLVVEYTPEPATMALLLLGMPMLIKRRKA